jgi:hypothetical protein
MSVCYHSEIFHIIDDGWTVDVLIQGLILRVEWTPLILMRSINKLIYG